MSFFDQYMKTVEKVNPAIAITKAISDNPTAKAFAAKLGFGTQQSDKNAEDALQQAKQAYSDLTPPDLVREHPELAQNYAQAPSEMGDISTDPAYKTAQMDQLAALSNLAKGGRNASSDLALAKVQGDEAARARGAREAVMNNMNARGMGGSGADLVAQLASNQAAQSNANMEDLGVLANQQNAAINAGNAAAGIGAGLESQDFNEQASKAAAADAINRFNTSNKIQNSANNAATQNTAQQFNTGLGQTEYQNKVQKQQGLAGANMGQVGFYQNQSNIGAQQAGNLMGGAAKLGAAAIAAARGGKIPGEAPFSGDTTLNDIVPIKASPGEVMVPRTLAKHGSTSQIGHFVKNPPKVPMGDHDKEAMLSALSNIRRKRMG